MRTRQATTAERTAGQQAFRTTAVNADRCDIVAVGKRRDGGTRFWCVRHGADATAKYGVKAKACRAAHMSVEKGPAFALNVDLYKGGIALWGAVPPVYDTTRLPLDKGIHVHARKFAEKRKEIDGTYSSIRLTGTTVPSGGLLVSAIDAIYYMVSSVFAFDMRQVICTYCAEPHLDKDWFSVHPHGRHLCAACGRIFKDTIKSVGNPICGLREAYGMKPHAKCNATRVLAIKQADFPGGIQIWGSNPALIWTSRKAEEEGIHVHAFRTDKTEPDIDDTFAEVELDGIKLDPAMVRVLMAQNTLPHLRGRVRTMTCTRCGDSLFSTGEAGFTPRADNQCAKCNAPVRPSGRFRKTIGNPLPSLLEQLAKAAPRTPQSVYLDLLPETP